jgi:hypothetical protein
MPRPGATTLLADPTLVTQAKTNQESQFLEGPDLKEAIIDAVDGNQSSHNRIAEYFFAETAGRDGLIERIGALVHMCTPGKRTRKTRGFLVPCCLVLFGLAVSG